MKRRTLPFQGLNEHNFSQQDEEKILGSTDPVKLMVHRMAATVLAMFPVLFVFFIAQSYFVRGITLTGLKR